MHCVESIGSYLNGEREKRRLASMTSLAGGAHLTVHFSGIKWSDVSNDLLSKADTKALADFRSKSVTNATCNFFSL